jgi:hypothetical protein
MSTHVTGAIDLRTIERDLLAEIILNQEELLGDSNIARKNGELACELMNLLVTRDAISSAAPAVFR